MKRIGIFAGTFDPVHKGHIAFALESLKVAKLDEIYFMPEMKPRRKQGFTHYAHRLAMLKIALKPYRKLKLLEVSDGQFSVAKTVPKLKIRFKDSSLFLLMGSEKIKYLVDNAEWPRATTMLKDFGLIVGLRGKSEEGSIKKALKATVPEFVIVETNKRLASSRKIRDAASVNQQHEDMLKTTHRYIKKHWVYTSVPGSANKS